MRIYGSYTFQKGHSTMVFFYTFFLVLYQSEWMLIYIALLCVRFLFFFDILIKIFLIVYFFFKFFFFFFYINSPFKRYDHKSSI